MFSRRLTVLAAARRSCQGREEHSSTYGLPRLGSRERLLARRGPRPSGDEACAFRWRPGERTAGVCLQVFEPVQRTGQPVWSVFIK